MKTSATYFQLKYLLVLLLFIYLGFPEITNAQNYMGYFPQLRGVIGFPDYQLNTGYIGASAGGASAYIELNVNFSGNLANVGIGGVGMLNGEGTNKKLSFQATSGYASMDFGPVISVRYNITIPAGVVKPLAGTFAGNPSVNLNVSDVKDFTTFLLDTVVELSDSLPSLPAATVTIPIGVTSTGTTVSADFEIEMDEELKNTIQGTVLSTSAGSITSENDTLSVSVSGSDFVVSGIKESLKSKLSLEVGVTGKVGITVGANKYDVGIPEVKFPIDIGTLSFTTNSGSVIFSGITDVKNHHPSLPEFYSLDQNYPNPFNPTTTINYALPKTSNVILSVYNTLGQKIKTLVNSTEAPGNYNVTFNGANLPSGIYFYHIQAGGYSAIKKLVLLK